MFRRTAFLIGIATIGVLLNIVVATAASIWGSLHQVETPLPDHVAQWPPFLRSTEWPQPDSAEITHRGATVDRIRISGTTHNSSGEYTTLLTWHRAGWPARSMQHAFFAVWATEDVPGASTSSDLLEAATTASGRWRMGLWPPLPVRFNPEYRLIPTLIIPTGFIVNSVFYAICLLVLVFWFRNARRRIRLARGRCGSCGYPLATGGRCPECGAIAEASRLTKR